VKCNGLVAEDVIASLDCRWDLDSPGVVGLDHVVISVDGRSLLNVSLR
jgi:hypothetical protein